MFKRIIFFICFLFVSDTITWQLYSLKNVHVDRDNDNAQKIGDIKAHIATDEYFLNLLIENPNKARKFSCLDFVDFWIGNYHFKLINKKTILVRYNENECSIDLPFEVLNKINDFQIEGDIVKIQIPKDRPVLEKPESSLF